MQELGIKIAIDDFGTGYSSLSRLKQFKCKTIKVDQSFVKNIEENSDDMIITESIIQLSHTLGMNIVAEGVETVEQFQFLQGKQCDEVQGYLFSQPIPRNDFETLLRIGACSVLDEHPSGMDRRQSFRVVLPYPLISMMTVLSVQGKAVDIGSTEVLIQDMGPRGLNFLSNLKVPVGPKIVLQFKFNIFQPLQVEGSVIRSVERKQGIYEYGAYFIEDEKFFSILTQLLSQLAVKLRKNPIVPGCGFYTKNKWTFFKKYLVDSRNR